MTLSAAQLTVETGGALLARGSAQDPGGKIVVTANLVAIAGSIDATGAPGGVVMLTSTGPLTLTGPLEVRSRGNENGGGSAELRGADVTISGNGRIDARGGGEDFGGDVDISAAGGLNLGGNIDASGGEGGIITITAAGALSIAGNVSVKADAGASGGSGGEVTIDAAGVLTMSGELSANGRNGSVDTGAGDGGNIDVSGSAIVVPSSTAHMNAAAGTPDGVGGDIDLTSITGAIDCQGRLEANGPGVDGTGGAVTIDAVGAASIGGTINTSGSRDGGGDIDLLAGEDLTVFGDRVSDGGSVQQRRRR